LTQPANISPIRTLPPPPDIPDSVSVVSHDSNNANNTGTDQIPTINLAALPPIEGGRDMDTLVEEDDQQIENEERQPLRHNNESPVLPYFEEGTCIDDDGINSRLWPIPHPDQYLLPHGMSREGHPDTLTAIDEEEDCCTCPNQNPSSPLVVAATTPSPAASGDNKPLAIRNRYKKKSPGASAEDEINESSSLLGGGTPGKHPAMMPAGGTNSRSGTHRTSPSTNSATSPAGSSASGSSGGSGSLPKKKNFHKTTHVTQV